MPGPVEITIKEWDVPKPGTRPHDPLVARDGSIWYAGINLSVLGRFDPKTTQIKEYPLKPKSGPHGLVDDKDGQHLVHRAARALHRQARSEDGAM